MKRRRFTICFLVSLCLNSLIAACNRQTLPLPAEKTAISPVTLTVSAAASLQDAMEAITPQFTTTEPNITISYNFGASGALQQQIEQGAPADIFFSAAAKQMDALAERGLILPDSRQNLVTNRLVLVAPVDSSLKITDLAQLSSANISRLAVGEFRSVPAGQYAKQVFEKLSLLEPLQSKFVFGSSVRNVLSAVESGNAEVGIVYATDAALSNQVKVLLTIPETDHSPIEYPIAIVKASPPPEAAQTFINFLTTEPPQKTFQTFGFGPIQSSP